MKLSDYFRLGWDQLKRRIVVTLLCTMGIAIGSASIVVALSFGESINHYSRTQMSFYLKSDEVTVESGVNRTDDDKKDPNSAKPYALTKAKVEMMRTFPHIKALATYQSFMDFQLQVDNKRGYINEIIATELDTLQAFDVELQQGKASDQDNAIILSYGSTMGLFDEQFTKRQRESEEDGNSREAENAWLEQRVIPYPMYQKQIVLTPQITRMNGSVKSTQIQIPVRVVGILKKPQGVSDDRVARMKTAYVSPALGKRLQDAIDQMNGDESSSQATSTTDIKQVKIKADNSANVKELEELIKKLKLSVQTNLHQEEQMQGELVLIRLIFGGAGVFILFVASISIIVAMTMSTYQRRRQIGIMKVLGANLAQIRSMFMVESALLGLLGGLAGIVLSYWVIWGINITIMHFSPPRPGGDTEVLFISLWILPVGLFFAIMTGVLSGIYPAIKASRTDALTAIKRD